MLLLVCFLNLGIIKIIQIMMNFSYCSLAFGEEVMIFSSLIVVFREAVL